MKNKKDLLREAFMEADIELFNNVIEKETVEWTPSEKFEKEMDRIIHKKKRLGAHWQRGCKWVACFLAAILICVSLTCRVDALRIPIIDFFVKVYESFSSVFVTGDENLSDPDCVKTKFLPTLIPEEYRLETQNVSEGYIQTIYTNDDGLQIVFLQQAINRSHRTLDTEKTELYTVTIGSQKGQYLINKETISIYWTLDNYSFCLTVPDVFTLEEAVRIAESVAPVE